MRPPLEVRRADALVVGAGVAGLSAALGLAKRRVHLITKAALGQGGASPWAQGGIAAAVGRDDSADLHAADTLAVAGGLGDPAVVAMLTGEGQGAIRRLVDYGVRFDRDSGGFALSREAAHSRARILHSRDATGAEVVRALTEAVRTARGIEVFDLAFACDLVVVDGRVQGVLVRDPVGHLAVHLAPAVILATGGIGQAYARTTNPPEATGDGLAMAARAGARLADLEFVQFHPTALDVGTDPMPLITEALRGRGAIVVDETGRRFLADRLEAAELGPRDAVSLEIARHLAAGHRAFLDTRQAVGDAIDESYPTVFAACVEHGVDPRTSPIPIAPAAHYHMGGIWIDIWGRTSLPGLFACGEVASSGVHGANRLASNSLLEAAVFGRRVAEEVGGSNAKLEGIRQLELEAMTLARSAHSDTPAPELTKRLRRSMWDQVGLLRSEHGLRTALAEIASIAAMLPSGAGELRNLTTVGRLVAAAAIERRESRGSHFRLDHPRPDPAFEHRQIRGTEETVRAPRLVASR